MVDEATIRKLQDALNDQAHKAQRDYRVLQDELEKERRKSMADEAKIKNLERMMD